MAREFKNSGMSTPSIDTSRSSRFRPLKSQYRVRILDSFSPSRICVSSGFGSSIGTDHLGNP